MQCFLLVFTKRAPWPGSERPESCGEQGRPEGNATSSWPSTEQSAVTQGGADPGRGRNCQSQRAGRGKEFHLLPQQHPNHPQQCLPCLTTLEVPADGTSHGALGGFKEWGLEGVLL